MESLLVRLMILAAIGELGLAAFADGPCMSRKCLANIERASRNISRIDWTPISVFPEEAVRLKPHADRSQKQRRRIGPALI